jgi:hypothetical protein
MTEPRVDFTEPAVPFAPPRATPTDDFLSAAEVVEASNWSETTVKRYFRNHADAVVPTGIGKKQLIALSALPPDVQRLHLARTGRLDEINSAEAQRAADDSAWVAANPDKAPEALRRKEIVRGWIARRDSLDRDRTGARDNFAAGHGISGATLHRWSAAYEANHRLADLAENYGTNKGTTRVDAERWGEILSLYLDRKCPNRTVAQVYDYYAMRCRSLGQSPVTYSTILRQLSTPEIEILKYAARKGIQAAMDRFGPFITRTRAEAWANLAWVGDHYNIDIRCVSPDGRFLATMWLTGWQDYKSTMLVGHEKCESPSGQSIQTALLRGIEKHGLPDIANTDNGKDYLSEAVALLVEQTLHIKIVRSKVKNAKAKTIERAFRNWSERFCPAIVGCRGRNKNERPEKLAELEKLTKDRIKAGLPVGLDHGTLPTWSELSGFVDHFVHWFNTRTGSDAEDLNGVSPAEVWKTGDNTIRTVDREALWMLWLTVESVTVRNCQVTLFKDCIFRDAVALMPWHGRPVQVRYNPDYLDKVFVCDPATTKLICVAPRVAKVPGYVPAMSKAANEALAHEKKAFKQAVGMEQLHAARIRNLTFAQSAGIPERADLPPEPTIADHAGGSVSQILPISTAARDAKTAEKRLEEKAAETAFRDASIDDYYRAPAAAPPKSAAIDADEFYRPLKTTKTKEVDHDRD